MSITQHNLTEQQESAPGLTRKTKHPRPPGEVHVGMRIRALRLGFYPVPGRPYLMRLSMPEDTTTMQVELCPWDLLPLHASSAPFRVWWEEPEIAAELEPVQWIVRLHRKLTFQCDEYGRRVR
jgi:hypothetical protein